MGVSQPSPVQTPVLGPHTDTLTAILHVVNTSRVEMTNAHFIRSKKQVPELRAA